MPKLIISALLLVIYGALTIVPTQAHEMKSEGSASALIHINPDDRAIPGKESEILFLITDKNKKFQLENCDCQASVVFGTITILNQPLSIAKTSYRGIFAPAIPFVFPYPGTYTITLSADPKDEGDFERFNISYEIYASDSVPKTSLTFKIIYSLVVITVLTASIIGFIFLINKSSKT